MLFKRKWTFNRLADKIVDCSNCGGACVGDPFQTILVKKAGFSIVSLFGACDKTAITKSFHFEVSNNTFYLDSIITVDYNCHSVDTVNTKVELKTIKDFGKINFIKAG